MTQSQRIYIGGLDPPRLTSKEVLDRLRTIPGIQIDEVPATRAVRTCDDDWQCFVHVQATRVSHGGQEHDHHHHKDLSPLQILQKHYHNVKWKGCRLSIQAAKPHFLERLAVEIQHRQQQQQQSSQSFRDNTKTFSPCGKDSNCSIPSLILDADIDNPAVCSLNHHSRRNYKIRKRYGDAAHMVDTKPWLAEDWSKFNGLLQKMRRKNEQQEKQRQAPQQCTQHKTMDNKLTAKQPQTAIPLGVTTISKRPVRAIHLRFLPLTDWSGQQEPDDGDDDVDGFEEKDDQTQSTQKVAISPYYGFRSSYVWSDDDDDDDDRHDNNNVDQLESCAPSISALSSTKHDAPLQLSQQEHKRVDYDEFASAMNESHDYDNKDANDQMEYSMVEISDRSGTDEHASLQDDVEYNLNILSRIFPEMANVKPSIQSKVVSDEQPSGYRSQETMGTKQQLGTASAALVVPRYDPNNPSSAQEFERTPTFDQSSDTFMLTQNKNVSTSNADCQMKTDDKALSLAPPQLACSSTNKSDDDTVSEDADSENNIRSNKTFVYEQELLESIFRQARSIPPCSTANEDHEFFHDDADQKTKASLPGSTKGVDDAATGFSFGFALAPALPPKTVAASKYVENNDQADSLTNLKAEIERIGDDCQDQGSFHVSSEVAKLLDPPITNYEEGVVSTENDDSSSPTEGHRVVAGLWFAEEVLDKYVDDFYAMNDGKRITANLDAFRQDPAVKEDWNRERYILTQDWKRKRKHATTHSASAPTAKSRKNHSSGKT